MYVWVDNHTFSSTFIYHVHVSASSVQLSEQSGGVIRELSNYKKGLSLQN